ncbi:MAG TPA: sigma 54-interacting transcriptional regulator [Geomonas sp.]
MVSDEKRDISGITVDHPAEEQASGIIRVDTDLVIVSLEKAAGTLLGIASDTLLGRRIDEVVSLANLGNLMRSGLSFSNQVVEAGCRRLACDYVSIVEEERLVGGALTLLRVLPEETAGGPDKLAELLRSAAAFLDMDHDGIIIVDRKGTVVMVNPSFAEVLDTTPQAMIGKHIHQAYRNSEASRMPMVMETGKAEIGMTHYMNGKEVISSRFPLIIEGRVIGAMGKIIFRDVREIALLANKLQCAAARNAPARVVAGKDAFFKYDINSIVGQSRQIAELKESLLRVAMKNSNVLLRGESGTGKELFAHALHAASTRRYAPFVKVNCAAIPEHLLESELFGYAEGAFTGARKGGQVGRFEQAHTGTIFLDEIGDTPLSMQVKLLRVLQERELVPLGGATPKVVDVRVVAATNSNLEGLVREGKFREDLYYRLNVVSLSIPSLRERIEDIYPITKNLIDRFNVEFGLEVQGLDPETWNILRHYDWPGNIRELRNVIESAFNVVVGPQITKEHLPVQLSRPISPAGGEMGRPSAQGVEEYLCANLGKHDIGEIMDSLEKVLIEKAIERCTGNKLQAAQLLGISRPGLYKKLQKHLGVGGDLA